MTMTMTSIFFNSHSHDWRSYEKHDYSHNSQLARPVLATPGAGPVCELVGLGATDCVRCKHLKLTYVRMSDRGTGLFHGSGDSESQAIE